MDNSPSGSTSPTSRNISAGSGSVTFKQSEAAAQEKIFCLPEVANSVEGIEFLGFTNETAQKIFTQFGRKHPNSDDTVLDYAQGWISQILLPAFQSLSDETIMNRVGFQESFITAILAPDVPGMCESEILIDRFNETLYLRWLGMVRLQRKVKAAGTMALAKKKDGECLKLDTNTSAGESSSQSPTILPPV